MKDSIGSTALDFRVLFESAPGLLLLVLTPDCKIATATDACLAATMRRREEIEGCDFFEAFPDNPASAEGAGRLRFAFGRVLQTKQADEIATQRYDLQTTTESGGEFIEKYWKTFLSPILDANGEAKFIIARVENVTASVALEKSTAPGDGDVSFSAADGAVSKQAATQKFLFEIAEKIRRAGNAEDLLFAVAQAVGEYWQVRRCLFNEIDLEQDLETVHRDYCRGVESVAGEHRISAYSSITTAEMETGKTVVNRDSQTDLRTAPFYEQTYARAGERAYLAVPLLRENRWVASLWVSDDRPRSWSSAEISLLEAIAERSWMAVEKLRSEAALRESEEKYRALTELSSQMVWILNAAGEITYLSLKWYDYTNLSLAKSQNQGWANILHPDERATVIADLQKYLARGEEYEMQFRLLGKNGAYRWYLTRTVPLVDAAGKTEKWLGVTFDIDEAKRAQEALRESETRFRHTFEQAPVGVLQINVDGTLRDVNPAYCRMIGYEAHELIGRSPTEWTYPEDHAADQIFRQSFNENPLQQKSHEKRYTCGDGSIIWVNLTVTGFKDENNNLFGVGIVQDVTTRKRATEALRDSAEVMRLAMDSASIYSWQFNAATNETVFSGSVEEIIGFPLPADYDGLQTFIHEDEREIVAQMLRETFRNKSGYDRETRYVNPATGEIIWLHTQGTFVPDENGEPTTRLVGITQNITKRKRAELNAQFLIELDAELSRLSEPEKIEQTTIESLGRYFEVERCFFAYVNGEQVSIAQEFRRKNIASSIIAEHRLSDYLPSAAIEEFRAGLPIIVSDVAASWRTAESAANFAALEIGAFAVAPVLYLGEWMGTLNVASSKPRVWREDELELLGEVASRVYPLIERARAVEGLRENRERLKFTLESANVGDWDLDLRSGHATRSFLHDQCFGATEPFDDWSYEKFLTYVYPEDRPDVERKFGQALAEQKEWHFECRVVWADASLHWIEGHGSVYRTTAGKPARMLGIINNITERKRAETEREELLEREQELRHEAEQANRLKDEFLATVSHELRTPLNSMLGWATIAKQSRMKPETVARAFDVIERNGRNQNQIIEDILDVSRIITGKLHLQMSPVALIDVINLAIETVRPTLDIKQINLATDFDAAAQIVMGDSNRLQQIVWNLLTNAVKFTDQNGQISITLRERNSFAEIIVKDNGVGIEPEFLPFVFDRFRQEEGGSNRKHGGLGLGLAIVRHIAEAHGGTVAAISKDKGHGASFLVRLPMVSVAGYSETAFPEIVTLTTQLETDGFGGQVLAGIRILLVDDELEALEMTTAILEQYGAIVTTADSAQKALAQLSRETPAVIISDVGMPDIDGYDLIGEIRNRRAAVLGGERLPAIALTAYARAADGEQARQAGFDLHLSKPVESAALISAIKDLLR